MKELIPEYIQTVLFWVFIIDIISLIYFIIKLFYKGGIAASKKLGPTLKKAFEEKKEEIEEEKEEKTEKVKKEAAQKIKESTKKIEREVERAEERDDTEKITELESKLQETIETIKEEEKAQLESINEKTEEDLEEVDEELEEQARKQEELEEKHKSEFVDFKKEVYRASNLIEEKEDLDRVEPLFTYLLEKVGQFSETWYETEAKDLMRGLKEEFRNYEIEFKKQKYLFDKFKEEIINGLDLIKEGEISDIERRYNSLFKMYNLLLSTKYRDEAEDLMKKFERVFGAVKADVNELEEEWDELAPHAQKLVSQMGRYEKGTREYSELYKQWKEIYNRLEEIREELIKFGIKK